MGGQSKCKNCKKFKRLCECGRPETITPEIEEKLAYGLSLGMPLVKALEYAGAKKTTYYRKCQDDITFRDKMGAAQNEMALLARTSLKVGITRSPALALAYLERKEKDEFSTKQIQKHEGTVNVKYSEEARKRLGKYQRGAAGKPSV